MRQATLMQRGVGLVELMVALTIGVIMVAGLVQIFSANKQGFLVQQAQAQLQENTRLTMIMLASNIAKAGFHQNAQDDPITIFTGTQLSISGVNNTSGSGTLANTDTIMIRFQGNDILTNCQGVTPAPGIISTNIYRVSSNNTLDCNDGVTLGFQPLIDNVADMQILYGVDTDADNSVNQYRTAANVANFNDVRSVHVALLMTSDAPILPTAQSSQYVLLDRTVTVPAAPAAPDRIQRRVVERVVALRSRLP